MIKPLSTDQAQKHLSGLPRDWYIAGDGKLARTFELASFSQALSFIKLVAAEAEKLDHHPDISWSYKKVEVAVITHEVEALSELDFKLAAAIEKCLKKA